MKALNEFLNERKTTGIMQGNGTTANIDGIADKNMIEDAIHSEIWRGDIVDEYEYELEGDEAEEFKQKYYDIINGHMKSKKTIMAFFIKNFDLFVGSTTDYFVPKRESKLFKSREYSLRDSTLVKDKNQFKEILSSFLSKIK